MKTVILKDSHYLFSLLIKENELGFLLDVENAKGNSLMLLETGTYPEYIYGAIRKLQSAIERYNTEYGVPQ